MSVVMEHVPGQGFKVSGIIAYGELPILKNAKKYNRTNADGDESAVQGSRFRSASGVIRLKSVHTPIPVVTGGTDTPETPVEGGTVVSNESIADAKFQCTLTLRNFRRPLTAAEIAQRKTQATVDRVRRDAASMSEIDILRLIPANRGKSDEELQAILDAVS